MLDGRHLLLLLKCFATETMKNKQQKNEISFKYIIITYTLCVHSNYDVDILFTFPFNATIWNTFLYFTAA